VDEHAVQGAVVDGHPAAMVEPQHQMGARNQRVGDSHVGTEVAANHDVMPCGESTLRPVVPNCQIRRGWSSHRDQLYR
jgi:hypothetical protein